MNKALLRPTDQVKGRPEVEVQNQGAEYGILAWKDGDKGFKLGERGEKIVDVWPIMGRVGAA